MKKLITIVLLFITFSASSQTLDNFFYNDGVKLLAWCAHPMTDFLDGSYTIYDDEVIVNINYKGGTKTRVRLYRSGNLFYNLRVENDTDVFNAFDGIQILKDLIMEYGGSNDETISRIERQLGQVVRNMSGKILACVIMTYAWLKY